MKKLVCGLAAAAILSVGFAGTAGPATASDAGTARHSAVAGPYGPTQPDVKETVKDIKQLISSDKLTPAKAEKLVDKLKDYYAAGLITKAKLKQWKKKIAKALKG